VLDKLLYKRYWIVLYTVHVIAFSLEGCFFWTEWKGRPKMDFSSSAIT